MSEVLKGFASQAPAHGTPVCRLVTPLSAAVRARTAGARTLRKSDVLPRRSARSNLICRAHSARVDDAHLVRRPQPWNYKLGTVYQHLLPGPLLFLPSLLQPLSTIISLEGAQHGHDWVHWLLSLLPVPQVCLSRALQLTSFVQLYLVLARH